MSLSPLISLLSSHFHLCLSSSLSLCLSPCDVVLCRCCVVSCCCYVVCVCECMWCGRGVVCGVVLRVVVVVVVVLLSVLCCCVCGVWVCLVCGVCVVWHAEKPWKHPCVAPDTPPCVDSKRPRVYRHHALVFKTCGRAAGTHGDVLNRHTEACRELHTGDARARGRRGEEEESKDRNN